MDYSQMHYAKERKPDSKCYILYYVRLFLEKAKLQGQKTDWWLPWVRGWLRRGTGEFLELMGLSYVLIVVIVT